MANNRQISSLADLAFEALLRHRAEISPNTDKEHDVLMQYKLKKETLPFLQSIADADPDSVKEFLEDNPQLAVLARGTVTTSSGNTYENVTAVELAYVLDDHDMCNSVLMPCIKKLSAHMIKNADEYLAKKMAEVAKQRSEFKPYDLSALTQAITADETLKATRKASKETEEAFAKFKEYFKPGVIKLGKSFIKEHLQEGYKVYDQNWGPWNRRQLVWFLINIIGTMQCRTEKCFEQACSQGLKEIVEEKKPLKRSVKLNNNINDAELTFRGSPDGKLLLGRDFFVEIHHGGGRIGPRRWLMTTNCLKNYVEHIDQAWKNLSSSCKTLYPKSC